MGLAPNPTIETMAEDALARAGAIGSGALGFIGTAASANLARRVTAIETVLANLGVLPGETKGTIETIQADIASLKAAVFAIQQDIASLRNADAMLQAQISQLQAEINQLQSEQIMLPPGLGGQRPRGQ